jgi:hypothetical protein
LTGPADREREVTAVLDAWDRREGECLIGGYAVSAYGKPRYSRDLDFVIPTESTVRARGRLEELGFSVRPGRRPGRPDALPDVLTLYRGPLSVDLMIGQVRDRGTQVIVPSQWISSRYREMRLLLLTGSTQRPVRVCRPEALWVLKIIAGRNQDLGDLYALSTEAVDLGEVRGILCQVMNPALRERLGDEAHRLEPRKIYADSQAERFLRSSSGTAQRTWEEFKRRFSEVIS